MEVVSTRKEIPRYCSQSKRGGVQSEQKKRRENTVETGRTRDVEEDVRGRRFGWKRVEEKVARGYVDVLELFEKVRLRD